MKIERLNENQIRCTLTREDLLRREIKLNEISYGSEKVKTLFQDMMQQAFQDCGFEVNNKPLMIEAIPVSFDSLILIITKVENPDELDSRFSRFSSEDIFEESAPAMSDTMVGLDDILELVSRISEARKRSAEKDAPSAAAGEGDSADDVFNLSRFFLFRDLESVIKAAKVMEEDCTCQSTLYKNQDEGNFYLIVKKAEAAADSFNKLCNVLSEYGLQADYMNGVDEFFGEHMDTIVSKNALQTLRTL